MRMFLAAIVLAVTLGACANTPQTPQQNLAAVELAFTGLVEQLVEARNTGLINDDRVWHCAQSVVQGIDKGMDAAHMLIINHQSIALVLGNIQASIRQLRRLEATGENVCVDSSSDTTRIGRGVVYASTRLRIQ